MDHPKRTRGRLLGTRRRKLVAAALLALAAPAAALAAFVIFAGVNGSSTGSFKAAGNAAALTVTIKGTTPVLDSTGSPVGFDLNVKNNSDTNRRLTALSATFTTTPAVCKDHMTFTGPDPGTLGSLPVIPAGGTYVLDNANQGKITVATTAPVECASGSWTINFNGTAS